MEGTMLRFLLRFFASQTLRRFLTPNAMGRPCLSWSEKASKDPRAETAPAAEIKNPTEETDMMGPPTNATSLAGSYAPRDRRPVGAIPASTAPSRLQRRPVPS